MMNEITTTSCLVSSLHFSFPVYIFIFFNILFIYLAVPGLSHSTRDLGALVVAC